MRTQITTTSTLSNNRAGIYHRIGSCQYMGFTKTFGHIKMGFTVITAINNTEQWREKVTSDEYGTIPKN